MSWYNSNYKFREPVTAFNNTSATTVDIELVIPSDFPRFWDNVASDNDDVVITASDGQTKLDFQVSSWNYANKTGTIKIKGYALPNGQLSVSGKIIAVYMYFGFDDGAGGSPTSVQNTNLAALSNAITSTFVEVGDPLRAGAQVLTAAFEPPGQSAPAQVLYAPGGTDIKTNFFFDVRPMLAARRQLFNGSLLLEEIDTFDFLIHHTDGTDLTSSMVLESEGRIFNPGYIRLGFQTVNTHNADNYLITLKLVTDTGRLLEFYATLKVRKISAPTA
ncbi:MAG: hypothetical protein CMH39_00130 [Micrococcales bacterium]|nr:hypothetical protein [Micrococcales bacterium]